MKENTFRRNCAFSTSAVALRLKCQIIKSINKSAGSVFNRAHNYKQIILCQSKQSPIHAGLRPSVRIKFHSMRSSSFRSD